MPTYVHLPENLVADTRFKGKSIYYRDYCNKYGGHRKRATEPTRSYTARMRTNKKLVGDMPLSDHFTTFPAALAMGYTRDDFQDTLGNTNELVKRLNLKNKNGVEDSRQSFIENVPGSLKKIEEAWLDEAYSTKRERGNIYGLAGKKMSLHQKEDARSGKATNRNGTPEGKYWDQGRSTKYEGSVKHKKTRSLPGLDKWLSTANEYEKQVLHKFVTSVGDAYKSETQRPKSTPVDATRPSHGKSIRISSAVPKSESRMISPRLEVQAKRLVPTPPMTPRDDASRASSSPPRTPPRDNTSRASSRASNDDANVEESDVATQVPCPPDQKPSSPLYEQRPSTPADLGHCCQNCDACKKKLLNKLVDELSGGNIDSYDELMQRRAHNNLNTIAAQMYRQNDYIHPGTSFQNVGYHKRGDFTIHPDFVSEKFIDLKTKQNMLKKYFGGAKIPY